MSNDLHFVGVSEQERGAIEAVGETFVREGLLKARKKSWQLLEAIRPKLKAGMSEDDARKACLEVATGFGVTKHWHRPYVRFGSGTMLNWSSDPRPDARLLPGDPLYIDLGPVWTDAEHGLEYEGDVGDSFVLPGAATPNTAAEECIMTCRRLYAEGLTAWQSNECTGEELYRFLKTRAKELGYELVEEMGGHRVSDFPHHKYSKDRLADMKFNPKISLWVLEVQITNPKLKLGAFFEDLLTIEG